METKRDELELVNRSIVVDGTFACNYGIQQWLDVVFINLIT